jgi:hypothetical protein
MNLIFGTLGQHQDHRTLVKLTFCRTHGYDKKRKKRMGTPGMQARNHGRIVTIYHFIPSKVKKKLPLV